MPEDDMGNQANWTLQSAAKAAIAGNDGNAQDFLDKTKETLDKISVEDLQKEIDSMKAQA